MTNNNAGRMLQSAQFFFKVSCAYAYNVFGKTQGKLIKAAVCGVGEVGWGWKPGETEVIFQPLTVWLFCFACSLVLSHSIK